MNALQRVLALGLLLCLGACSPALNWREVRITQLQAMLPCKPDRAVRTVQLAGQAMALEMAGCEADGGLFAISRLQPAQGVGAQVALRAWRTQALANMRSTGGAAESEGPQGALYLGHRENGQPVQAQLAWWVYGEAVFHVAVYAHTVRPEMVETLFAHRAQP